MSCGRELSGHHFHTPQTVLRSTEAAEDRGQGADVPGEAVCSEVRGHIRGCGEQRVCGGGELDLWC